MASRIHELNLKWWIDPHTGKELDIDDLVPEKLMLTVTELSEALEGHRKGLMDDHLLHRAMFEVEIADAFIRLFDLAGAFGFDLDSILEEKLEYNRNRPDHKTENRILEGGKKY